IQAGREAALPVPIPFRNFVAQARLGISQEEHVAFFRQMLGDVQEPTAPFGLLEVHRDGGAIEEVQQRLEPRLCRRIRQQARRLGVSSASMFHWAWAQVLSRITCREDVVFGTVLFGRMHGGEGADRALGIFINTLPIRVLLGEVGIREGIRKTHENLAQLRRHEHASLALAQRCSALSGNAPLFSTLLNYRHIATEQNPNHVAMSPEGMEVLSAQERTNYPFALSVEDLGEDFELTMQAVHPLGQRVCGYMSQAMLAVIEALEDAPQAPAWSIDVLGKAERHRLLVQWNQT